MKNVHTMLRLHFPPLLKNNSLLVFSFVFLLSCKKEITLDITSYYTNTNIVLNAIYENKVNHNIFIVGGDTWEPGIGLLSTDFGEHWTHKEMHWAGLNTISTSYAYYNDFWISGLNACFYIRPNDTLLFTPDTFRFYKSISHFNPSKAFVVGGEGFKTGYIDILDINTGIKNVYTSDHALNAVIQLDSFTILAAGYGIALRSEDGGSTWKQQAISGDHFVDYYFLDNNYGFLIGHFGSIFKTQDGGKNWENLRNASSPLISDRPFRSIVFKNKLEGVIVGDYGLLFYSCDGGSHWQRIHTETDAHLMDVRYFNDRYWVCGSSGTVLSFVL